MWVAPFLPIVVLGQNQAPRVFLSEAVSFAVLWSAALGLLPRPPVWAVGIVGVALLSGSLHVSRLFFADTTAWAADLGVATQIMARIRAVDPDFDASRRRVLFSGVFQPANIWTRPEFDVFGHSYFAWDHAQNYRLDAFFRTANIASLTPPDAAAIDRVRPALAALPAWPRAGAVALIDDVMVVKLGP